MTARPALNLKRSAKKGITLIELLIVMALIALAGGLGISSLGSIREKQALTASASELKSVLNQAHIYAREARDEKAWGVESTGNNTFVLLYGTQPHNQIYTNYKLEAPIKFGNGNFKVWFELGAGNTGNEKSIILASPRNFKMEVKVGKTGVVNINNL